MSNAFLAGLGIAIDPAPAPDPAEVERARWPERRAAAHAHAKLGRRVFPVDPQTKVPMVTGWNERASTDPDMIDAWWGERPNAMPGWALPADVCVLDTDPRNGGDESEKGLDLPATRTVRTGGGGTHRFYRVPLDQPVKNGALKTSPGYTERVGLDVKTCGGFVVLDGVTRSDGGRYELVGGERELAPCPEWLLRAKARGAPTAGDVGHEPALIWAVGGDTEATMTPAIVGLLAPKLMHKGERHEVARAVGGALAASGWGDDAIRELVRQLPSTDPDARVKDALDAAERTKAGEPVPMFGALGQLYSPAVAEAIRVMAGGPALAAALESPAADAPKHTAPEPSAWVEMSVTDICAPLGPVNYIVRDLDMATDGAPTIFGGYGFSGKTMAAQSAALSIVAGRDVWGRYPVTPKAGGWRVLHVDYEQGRRLTADRYQRLMRGMGITRAEVEGRLVLVPMPRFYLNPANIDATEDFLERKMDGFDLCVIDSFLASAPGLEENDSGSRHLLDMFTRIAERRRCLTNVIAHARKTANGQGDPRQALRGTSAIFDACGSVLLFDGEEPKAPKQITHTKARISGQPLDPFALTFTDGFAGDDRTVMVTASGAQEVRQAAGTARLEADCLAIMAFVVSQPGRQFAGGARLYAAKTGIPEVRVRTALEQLAADGRVRKHDDSTNQQPLRFVPGAP